MRRSKPSVAWIYQKWKGKLLEKADWIGSYSWYLRAIEVKCVSKRNRFRYSTLVCMIPWLKAKNDVVLVIDSPFLEYIFFILPDAPMRVCLENSVIARLIRRAFMDSLTFSLLIFLNLIQDFYNLKNKKKRLPRQEYLRNEKEKLLNKKRGLLIKSMLKIWNYTCWVT